MAEPASRPTIALVDASNFLYRAFYAIRGLTGPGGRPTNAVFGFATMLRKLLHARKPEAIAIAFDRAEKTFRHELDETYKAQRAAMPDDLVPQIEDAKRFCRAMGLAVVEEPGYEADDLIATLAERAKKEGLRVEIASADKDLFQLVEEDRVVVWHPVKEEVLDAKGVETFFGVPPDKVVDVLALTGDASDNIPGVAGIGEKGARELIAAFGSLDGVYARLGEVTGKKREALEKGKKDALRSRVLATVVRDAPVPAGDVLSLFRIPPPTPKKTRELTAFYEEMGFSKLRKDLIESTRDTAEDAAEESNVPAPHALRWVTERADLSAFVAAAARGGRVGLHVECAPPRPFPAAPLAAAAALPSGDGIAFPLTFSEGIEVLASLFSGGTIVTHDSKRLFLAAAVLGISPPAHVVDVMLASYVVAPGLHAHDLAGDARGILDLSPEAVPALKEVAGKEGLSSAEPLVSDVGLSYLAPRARLPLALEDALNGMLAATPALRNVLKEIEHPLVPVLARMEIAGIAVDRGTLAGLSKEFGERLSALEAKIQEAAGEAFNIGSPQQLGRILFEKLAYPSLKKTAKTKAYATGSDVLEELAALGTGTVPGLVLEWRELSKLKGTYVDALPEYIAKDGRIHTRYDQAVAATGRLSSNDPNLQNIPVRTDAGRNIRRAFVAPAGRLLVTADYSQVELRILAHLSGDEALIGVFRRGEDIHRATAARVFGVPLEKVTADQRRGAKTINFGILYGMGAYALAGQLGVPRSEAKEFIDSYFERFPKVRACLDGVLEKARATGRTETIFGRIRPIPGLADRNHAVRSNAERMAMNAPFQGSAADLIKRAMITLDAALAREIPSARLLLQVHDELVLECDAPDADAAAELARRTMEGAASLTVPLTVDVGRGANWAEAK
ncbi:MAG: DNA polymerase I [Thermoanaerobaculia bacterium]